MSLKILLVEDDEQLSFMIKDAFETVYSGCYEVRLAKNGQIGLEMFKAERPDMVVADVEMPVMNGLQMTRRIREFDTTTPILFTSIHGEPADVVRGLEVGGNNYIKKFYGLGELHSYIQTHFRNCGGASPSDGARSIGIFRFHPQEETLENTLTGETVALAHKPAMVLQLLADRRGEVIKREIFLQHVWENDYSEENLNNQICQLRKQLKADKSLEIMTVKGIGYKLEVKA